MIAARTAGRAHRRLPTLLRLARLMASASRWKLAVIGLLTLGIGGASALAAILLIPILAAAGVNVGGDGRPGSHLFGAVLSVAGARPSLGASLAALAIVTAVQAALNVWQLRTVVSVTHDVVATLRQRLFESLCQVEWARFGEYRSADLLEALTARVERVGWAARSVVSLGGALVMAAVYVVLAFSLSASMTLVTLAVGALLGVAQHQQRRKATETGEAQAAVSRTLYRLATESLTNMKTIRTHDAAGRHAAELRATAAREREVGMQLASVVAMSKLWLDVGAVALLAVVTVLAIRIVGVPAGELIVLLFVFTRLMPQVSASQQAYQNLIVDLPAFVRVQEAIDQSAAEAEAQPGARRTVRFEHEIRLDEVSYGYGGDLAVQDISVAIPAGSTVAIVGRSGAGKTTLADIVLGLIEPQAGRVLVDGVPLTPDHLAAWREQVGYVSQDGALFHDTVRANLLWAAPSATEAELWAALRLAAADFVADLPQGLETIVGDRGTLLSGGERQRLALARALLRRPKLLVLDEPTSALDAETEQVLDRALRALPGGVTVLLITHRLSAIRRADMIYVLDRGRVAEYGSWEDLASRGGRFDALCHTHDMDLEAADAR
jgi:ATP-binding cassette subfamily C protein